ncbi:MULTISPECIES: glutathione S-transferase family protein [Pseudomonas]|uniref:glutathione S-transferase family protein n=1 Tax=Pseudomonas TaxID=286 RepID=UPI001F218429|nr:glutathione S-transferase family protein [Pseudomonas marginalis]MCF5664773.1 glutathione S-transferase family protein [Pseudomonas marginalis]MCF8980263.1 glutathione S-transferase family protein [Pseudomonas syringae]
MNAVIELYGAQTGNSLRAAIALEEAGVPYTARLLNLRALEHRDPAYLRLNPAGQVPTLVDNTSVPARIINQSNAIIQYADTSAPGRLAPAQLGWERDRVFDRYFFFVTDVIAPSHAAFFLRQTGLDDAAAKIERLVIERLVYSENFLTDAFMAGDHFSMADISAFTIAASVRDKLDWATLRRLSQWFNAVDARPAVQRGMRAFENL